ncbi:MAG: type 4a pilus biogenesis protein PilO [Blastocatellia bacterium]|jgi:Tfp pilus assembly protein PilO|nr:type 4a pilus biogenesis protein PilO [Blastocatellia bacterium]MBK6425840.1 type 4a pilus biogenesis protein PilO [Blastocatellia bacterium]
MAAQGATVTTGDGGFLDRFPWWAQLVVLIVLILVIILAVDWFLFRPKRLEAAKLDQQAQELRRQNQEAETIRQNIEAYQATLDGLNARLDQMKVKLPEQREISNVFESTKQLMSASGLKLVQFQTSAKDTEVPQKYYTEAMSTVKVAGSYREIQTLFEKLSAFDRVVNVTDITITKAAATDQVQGDTAIGAFTLTAFYISEANRQALETKDLPPPVDPKTGKPVAPPPGGAPPAAPAPAPK